jgi:hypothetical protein
MTDLHREHMMNQKNYRGIDEGSQELGVMDVGWFISQI